MAKLRPLRLVLSAVDRITQPIDRVTKRIDRMTGPVRRVRRSLERMGRALGLGRLGAALRRVAQRLAVLGGLAAGAAVAGMRKFVQMGDNVVKTADKLGLSVEALQEMRFAAERSGVAVRTFDMGIQRFIRRTAEAAGGTGEAREALRFLGIQLRDASGRMRPTTELFGDVADAIMKIEDPAMRVRVAFKLFDSEGVALLNMLQNGKEGFDSLREEARRLGFVLERDTLDRTVELQDAWTNLTGIVKGLSFVLATEMLPFVEEITEGIRSWITANQELIRTRIREWARRLSDGLRSLVGGVRDVVAKVGGWENALLGVGAAIAGLSLGGLGLVIAGLATPIGQIVALTAGLGVLAGVVATNWEKTLDLLVGETISAAIRRNWDPLISKLEGLATTLESIRFHLDAIGRIAFGPGMQRATAGGSSGGGLSDVIANPSQTLGNAIVSGLIRIVFDGEGRPRVSELSGDGPVDIEAETGRTMPDS